MAFCAALGGLVLFFSEEFVASVNRCALCVLDACDVWAATYGTFVWPIVGVIYFMIRVRYTNHPFSLDLLGEPRFRLSVFPSSAHFLHICLIFSLLFPYVYLLLMLVSRHHPTCLIVLFW